MNGSGLSVVGQRELDVSCSFGGVRNTVTRGVVFFFFPPLQRVMVWCCRYCEKDDLDAAMTRKCEVLNADRRTDDVSVDMQLGGCSRGSYGQTFACKCHVSPWRAHLFGDGLSRFRENHSAEPRVGEQTGTASSRVRERVRCCGHRCETDLHAGNCR